MVCYQVFAQVYPGQCNRILVHTHIFPVQVSALPDLSMASYGNFHTLRRYFPTAEQAQAWAEHLKSAYAKGPVENPIPDGSQQYLF
jgi:hypothetical protein